MDNLIYYKNRGYRALLFFSLFFHYLSISNGIKFDRKGFQRLQDDFKLPPMPSSMKKTMTITRSILLYKPPIGFSTFYIARRLIKLRRKRMKESNMVLDSVGIKKTAKKMRRNSIAFDIDTSDREYRQFGGIIPVRAEYCYQSLKEMTFYDENDSNLRDFALDLLMLPNPLELSYELFVNESADSISHLYDLFQKSSYSDNHWIFIEAAQIGEVRLLDALLRLLRGKLLVSTRTLTKRNNYFAGRLRFYQTGFLWKILQYVRFKLVGATLDQDKRNLVMAKAAVDREMERLGRVQRALLERSGDIDSSLLVNKKKHDMNIQDEKIVHTLETWNRNAHGWRIKAKGLIMEMLTEHYRSTEKRSSFGDDTIEQNLDKLSNFTTDNHHNEEALKTSLILVNGLLELPKSKHKRIYSYIKSIFKNADLFGIPSSLGILFAAQVIHGTVAPQWNEIKNLAKKGIQVVEGIIIFRFWEPFRDIILDLLNRRPKLVPDFAQQNEEQSLDNMLLDLGVSDGTPQTRDNGIAASSRLYENELNNGPIRSAFRGNLIRLVLIQVQLLKTSLYEAMDSIDHLVDSNMLNVRLLAAIPAFLLIRWGTLLFFTTLFRFRSRDMRPVQNVLAEMSEYLSQIERSLLLSDKPNDDYKNESADLGEIVFLMHSYLTLLDYVSPTAKHKFSESIHHSMQDLLLQGTIEVPQQLALLQLVRQKHEKLQKRLILL